MAARALRNESYPLGARATFEVVESSVISAGLVDHNAAAQLTIPTLMELGYRGGLHWAAPVTVVQIMATTAFRAAARRAPNLSVYWFQASALVGADRLAAMELERQGADAVLAAARSQEAVASGYQAGRYAAATETVGDDELGHPMIPHDRITPVANFLFSLSPLARGPGTSALAAIGPRQQKAQLRGLSVGLLDALMAWRRGENQRRPRLSDQLGTPHLDVAKGDPLLTPLQTTELFNALDAQALRGGPLDVGLVSSGTYGSRMVLAVNGRRVTVPTDQLAFPTTATNLMRAAPQGALLWGLLELQPSQNGLPFPVGLLASVPATLWLGWARCVQSGPALPERTYLRSAILVAAAHTGITAAIIRLWGPDRPDGYAPFSLSLFAPATMIGGAWSRLDATERAVAVGALALIAGGSWSAIPKRRAFLAHAFQVGVCFVTGVKFDQARTQKLNALSKEATERLQLIRDAAGRQGRIDELDLCRRACDEAHEAVTTELSGTAGSDEYAAAMRSLADLLRVRLDELAAARPVVEEPLREFQDVLATQRALVGEQEGP